MRRFPFALVLLVIVALIGRAESRGGSARHHSTPSQLTKRQNNPAKKKSQERPKLSKAVYEKVAPSKKSTEPGHPLRRACSWYLQQCTEKPLRTKSYTAAIINLIGDVLAQNLESHLSGEPAMLDYKRTITFFLCGLCFVGPFVHAWYELLFRLGKALENRFQSSKLKQIVAQVVTDQTVGVALYFPSYFYAFEALESLVLNKMPSLAKATEKLSQQLGEVLIMQYRIFPLANAINFAFVPPELRVLFSNTISIFWNMYLCTLLAK
mmetsp:Transcript_78385/g.227511  ORF Transcript_78385/g.227511 Transcript_78385/m.227511 type:complete len:266 (+) Transcript_78385:185-982(+)